MDWDIAIAASLILTIGLAFFTFFSIIPRTVQTYKQFQLSSTPRDFSLLALMGTFSAALLTMIYCSMIRYLFIFEPIIPSIVRWIAWGALFIVTFGFFLPKAYLSFQRWKSTSKSIWLSITSVLLFLSFFIFSFIVLKALLSILGVKYAQ